MTQISKDPLAIVTLGAYLLGKLSIGGKTSAPTFAQNLRLDRLITPPTDLPPVAAITRDHATRYIGEAAAAFDRADYPNTVASIYRAIHAIVALMDAGRMLEACYATAMSIETVRAKTQVDLGDLLMMLAGIVREAESGSLEGELATEAHQARVRIYSATNGRLHDFASWIIARLAPPIAHPAAPSLLESVGSTVRAAMQTDGYYRFVQRLPADLCGRIKIFAETAPTLISRGSEGYHESGVVDLAAPGVSGFHIDHQATFDNPDVQAVIMDPAFRLAAQEHFESQAIFIGPAMWWSLPFEGAPNSTMAQRFHWDDGWFKWAKFFIYLVDVDETNGPHTFVAGSHRRDGKPQELLNRGYQRIPDNDIRSAHPPEAIVSFAGETGSVFVVDTAGWHKGEKPTAKPRLVLQLTFVNSVLGSLLYSGKKLGLKQSHAPAFRAFVAEHREMFPDLCFETA